MTRIGHSEPNLGCPWPKSIKAFPQVANDTLGLKVALAYSGGLDTSVCIKWLQEKYKADVITVTLDLGQKDNLREIGKRAYLLGARNHYEVDARHEFVTGY